MRTCYEESYLFVLWALKYTPYPRNVTLQINTGAYGLRATLETLNEHERASWQMYRASAHAALGDCFLPDRESGLY